MATYGTLIEYLLGVQKPDGGKLVRFGAHVTRIPQFPPNFTITLTIYPHFNAYANIQWLASVSPHMVPSAFWYETRQFGILFEGAFLSQMMQDKLTIWIEFTQADPIVTTLTNVTPLLQYYEFGNSYLVIQSEEDYKIVRRLINEWYVSSRVVQEKLDRTNALLESLGAREGVPLAPQPPITARRF